MIKSFICYSGKITIKKGQSKYKNYRPKVNQQKLNQAIAMYHSQRMAVKEIEEATGVLAATIYWELKKEQHQ